MNCHELQTLGQNSPSQREAALQRNAEKSTPVQESVCKSYVSDYLIFSSFTDTTDYVMRDKCEAHHKAETVRKLFY